MGGITGAATVTAGYNFVGQITSLAWDGWTWTRQYNTMLQLTRITVPGVMDMEYRYPTNQTNNGRIASQKDYVSGEDITYQYDALNRLKSATAAGPDPWSQTYNYDGFGNSTGADPATNRLGVTDANGNAAVMGETYDHMTWRTGWCCRASR